MTPIQSSQLNNAVNRLVKVAQPSKVIFFGSQARGDADSRSDYDFLVICPLGGDRAKLVTTLFRALGKVGIPCDVMVMTPEEFELDKHIPGTIARPAW